MTVYLFINMFYVKIFAYLPFYNIIQFIFILIFTKIYLSLLHEKIFIKALIFLNVILPFKITNPKYGCTKSMEQKYICQTYLH